MPDAGHVPVRELKPYRDVDAALKAIGDIYETARQCVRDRFEKFLSGARDGDPALDGCYPISASPSASTICWPTAAPPMAACPMPAPMAPP